METHSKAKRLQEQSMKNYERLAATDTIRVLMLELIPIFSGSWVLPKPDIFFETLHVCFPAICSNEVSTSVTHTYWRCFQPEHFE